MYISFIVISITIGFIIFFSKKKTVAEIFSTVFLIMLLLLSGYSYKHIHEVENLYFTYDSLGVLLSFVITVLSFVTFYHSRLYLLRHNFTEKQISQYFSYLIILITAMISAYFASNLAILWVSIEATTLFVSLLINFERTKIALEAAWKYLFVSSIGVALAFVGILFLSMTASNSGITNLNIPYLVQTAQQMDPFWLKMAFLLTIVGFSAKMGLFPLHTVTVDAHTVAPPPISAFISTTLMNVGFIGIFRIFTIISQTTILNWAQNVLIITGVLSVFMSAIQMLKTIHSKRMFAFSSLEHMGIVALGLSIGGIGYYAAILHLILHSFAKAGLFYQIGQIHHFYGSYFINDISGYFKRNTIGALALIFGFISILAIPPSGMFVSEFLVFKAMFLANHYLIAIFVLLLLSIIIYSFSKNTSHMLFHQYGNKNESLKITPNKLEPVSQFILFSLVIYLGINPPDFFVELITNAISILH